MNNIKNTKYACGGVVKPFCFFVEGDNGKELICPEAEMPIGLKMAVSKAAKDIQSAVEKFYEYNPL